MRGRTEAIGDWWARDRGADTARWVANYQQSLGGRQRTALLEIIKALTAETVLEVGCHCGPNLMRFATECPTLRMIGIDISPDAVTAGRAWSVARGVSDRVQFNVGRVPEALDRLPAGSADVVLSCYTLAYLAPADLDAALYAMGRVARRAVVVAEPMVFAPSEATGTRSLSGYCEWRHCYIDRQRWIGTMRDWTMRRIDLSPPVDRLNGIVVYDGSGLKPPSPGRTKTRDKGVTGAPIQ